MLTVNLDVKRKKWVWHSHVFLIFPEKANPSLLQLHVR